ncbi:translation initiation factor IF-3 [Bacteroidota bacterium]|nr:translation initiation factor IF-3 [Bacteroidota bacterium]MEC7479670.1 translation initiation factor IF-3 [Pseudomonadota bacterium]MEC7858781.1 translation initiation factor IF-3 [Pseudomonadota bacterium]MEC8097200.1 translation initiation factor IF-3 [Pseudomonadota bacterium]
MRPQRRRPPQAPINQFMKAEKLTVISETGEKLGNYSKSDAVDLAKERGLDILQITFDKEPCVAKIIDYGKYKFDQKKKQSLAKKNQKRLEQKEIKMRPNIDRGDINVKLKKIVAFIERKANVKISVTFRGRELGNTSFGKTLLDSIIKETEDIASVLVEPKFENRTYSALLAPKKIK